MIAPEISLFIINACVHFFVFGIECYSKCISSYTVPLHARLTTMVVIVWMALMLLALLVHNFDVFMWKDWTIFCGLLVFSAWSTSGWKKKE